MTEMNNDMLIPFDETEDIRMLEAVLFAAASPMRVEDLASQFQDRPQEYLSDLLKRLQSDYAGRGVELECSDAGWVFRTASDLGARMNLVREEPRKLSRAAMETLAIIAYHQPVTRAEIETIRGVTAGKGTIDLLLELGWVKPGRRRQVPGRPLTFVTTPQFLDHFGLESIMDLPAMEELKAAGMLDRRQATSIMADLFEDGVLAEEPLEQLDEDLQEEA